MTHDLSQDGRDFACIGVEHLHDMNRLVVETLLWRLAALGYREFVRVISPGDNLVQVSVNRGKDD